MNGHAMPLANNPLVTIAIPAYRPQFLRTALASAVAQTWPRREILVSQDGDDPEVRRICAEFPEVRLSQGEGQGIWVNVERCLRLSSGAYIKLLFDDDWLDPDCVRRMIGVFEGPQGRNCALVASRRWLIDDRDRRYATLGGVPGMDRNAIIPQGRLWPLVLRQLHNFIGELTTVMIRRSDLAPLGEQPLQGFGWAARTQRDLRLFLALNLVGAVYVFHTPLSAFRIHADQSSSRVAAPRYVASRVGGWLDLVEIAGSRGHVDAAHYRHGLQQIERLCLKILAETPEVQDLLEPMRLRVRELLAAPYPGAGMAEASP